MNETRLEFLLDRYFDEALAAEERAELEALLLSWPQARALFWRRARFNSLLRRRGREIWGRRLALEQGAAKAPSPKSSWAAGWSDWVQWTESFRWWALGAAACLLFALGFSGRAWLGPGPRQAAVRTEERVAEPFPESPSVATLLRAVDVKWVGAQGHASNVLSPGWLRFEHGVVEVQFHRGARVVIEGPAEFEVISDMQARCLLGEIRADVPPPARGFEIITPLLRAVDLGTVFGLKVKPQGPAELQVYSGKVAYQLTRPQLQSARELTQGHAIRVDDSGAFSEIPFVASERASQNAVEQRASASMDARFAAWKVEMTRLQQDPSLLVQYTFEDISFSERLLRNSSPRATLGSQGTIIGCSRTEGRWPGKQSLDFKQVGDRIRLALPMEHKELTCVTWVRPDAMERPFSALLMSGDATLGELQWQLERSGRVLVGKRLEPGWGNGKVEQLFSQPILSPRLCGSWMQLAFVYDGQTGRISHYFDGQKVGEGTLSVFSLLRTDLLEIGNWTPAQGYPREPIRAFTGRMDELLIFARALSDEEIASMWEVGRPL